MRLIVGSANLTVPGYRHNREMAAILDFVDAPESAPRTVLDDALLFIHLVLERSAADPQVINRVRRGLEAISARMRRVETDAQGVLASRVPEGVLCPLLCHAPRAAWPAQHSSRSKTCGGSRSARDVRVVTPFVGDPNAGFQRLTGELATIPHLRSAGVLLAVPGVKSDAAPGRRIVALPARFRDAWAEAWGREANDLELCVVTPDTEYRGRPVQRPLHAKGLFVCDGRTLACYCAALATSSAAGMGVYVANIEANLCYLDRIESDLEQRGLEDRLPVDWERDRASGVEWPEAVETSEEDGEDQGGDIPPVFAWATVDPTAGEIVLWLNAAHPLPEEWEIRLPHAGAAVLGSYERWPSVPPEGRLVFPLPGELFNVPVTSLRLRWTAAAEPSRGDDPGQRSGPSQAPTARKPLRSLTAEGILACILSGCDPAEWVNRQFETQVQHSARQFRRSHHRPTSFS